MPSLAEATQNSTSVWSPSDTLSPRIQWLRDQYWDFYRRDYTNEVRAFSKRYRGGYLSWNYWGAYAPKTAAPPDGRRRGQVLSNGVCPVNGADRLGPTAVVNSVGHLGLETAPNGGSHTISFSPGLLRSAENRRKVAGLLRAYVQVGGTCLQINVVSPEMLRAAQREPAAALSPSG